jgi:hypothetical protein
MKRILFAVLVAAAGGLLWSWFGIAHGEDVRRPLRMGSVEFDFSGLAQQRIRLPAQPPVVSGDLIERAIREVDGEHGDLLVPLSDGGGFVRPWPVGQTCTTTCERDFLGRQVCTTHCY